MRSPRCRSVVAAMAGMVRDMKPDTVRMKAAAGQGYSTATDLADWLVRTLKMPFRKAHHVTGQIVAAAEAAGVPLENCRSRPCARSSRGITKDGVQGAFGRAVGREPHQFWRHGGRECPARSCQSGRRNSAGLAPR